MQYTELGMHCAAAFAEELNKAPQLKQLGLGGCLLMSCGANTFADFLRRNTTLESLDLDCNAILDEGVRSVCEALCHNTTLCVLKIGNNSMTNESVESVAKLLSLNKTLKGLYVSGTHGFNTAVDSKGTQIIGRVGKQICPCCAQPVLSWHMLLVMVLLLLFSFFLFLFSISLVHFSIDFFPSFLLDSTPPPSLEHAQQRNLIRIVCAIAGFGRFSADKTI